MRQSPVTLEGQIWLLCSAKASYHGSETGRFTEPSIKPPTKVVFSFTEQEITRTEHGSQEDRKKKVNMSVFIPQKEGFYN